MDYSDGYTKEPTIDFTQIDGFTIDSQENIDVENRKLTNVKKGRNINDAINKKQLEDYVDSKITDQDGIDLTNYQCKDTQIVLSTDINANNKIIINLENGSSNSDAVNVSQLSNYLRIDGENKMVSFIDTNSNRIQNCAPGRHGTADVMTHLQFEIFYLDLNVDSGKIEVQNNIDMKQKRISGLQDAIHHSEPINKFQFDNIMLLKADKTQLNDYFKKDSSGNLNMNNKRVSNPSEPINNSNLVTKKYHDDNLGSINGNLNQHKKKSDKITLNQNMDANNFNVQNVKYPVNSHDAKSLSFLSNELRHYAHRTGTIFSGDIDMQNNGIYVIKNVDDNSAINKKYVDDKISKIKQNGIDMTPYLKKDGSILMTNDFNLNNNKIIRSQ